MSAEAPPATGIEPFHVVASHEPDIFTTKATRRVQHTALKEAAMSTTVETDIQPFQVEIPEEKIDDLRRRIAATRWPTKELVDDRSQGVQLAALQGGRALLGRATTTSGGSRSA